MKQHTSQWAGIIIPLLVVVAVGYWVLNQDTTGPELPHEPDEVESVYPLEDGEVVDWLGTFRSSPVVDGVKAFGSEELGLSLAYPPDHLLFENMSGAPEIHTLTIGPEAPILDIVRNPVATEAPPSIHLTFHHEPELAVANIEPLDYLLDWVAEHTAYSNFNPDDPAYTLATTTVSGVPALAYHTSLGLYDSNDYVAFVHGERVVIASVFDSKNEGREGIFQAIIDSIELR